MHAKNILILALLAAAGASASATTVTDWGTLGPVDTDVHANTYVPGAVDDIYLFSLGDYSDVPTTANYYQATSRSGVKTVDFTDATIALFSGVYGDATADTLVGSYAFGTSMTPFTFSGLTAGQYYFEVTGTAGTKGSDYYFDVAADSAVPPSVVPEPANAALLFAGIGLFGFMAARRQRR
ncbi:MAG: FxDxF family PEP-CTERM protein [Betaproteobacteria bacterium]